MSSSTPHRRASRTSPTPAIELTHVGTCVFPSEAIWDQTQRTTTQRRWSCSHVHESKLRFLSPFSVWRRGSFLLYLQSQTTRMRTVLTDPRPPWREWGGGGPHVPLQTKERESHPSPDMSVIPKAYLARLQRLGYVYYPLVRGTPEPERDVGKLLDVPFVHEYVYVFQDVWQHLGT